MRIHELKVSKHRRPSRKGRGISAGQGKTAGRGTKGQNARSGGGVRPGFEGGQNPLSSRVPKLPGFKSRRRPVATVTTSQLNQLKAAKVSNQSLAEAGLVHASSAVKVVLGAPMQSAKTINLQAASKSAVKAIEKAGGKFQAVDVPKIKRAASTKARSDNKIKGKT